MSFVAKKEGFLDWRDFGKCAMLGTAATGVRGYRGAPCVGHQNSKVLLFHLRILKFKICKMKRGK